MEVICSEKEITNNKTKHLQSEKRRRYTQRVVWEQKITARGGDRLASELHVV